jgi:hypothetical protein
MKHEDPSEARSALARRITQRALDATKHARLEIVPMGEPERGMSTREWDHLRDEEDALRELGRFGIRALRSLRHYPNTFGVFPGTYSRGAEFDRRVIQRLVDKGTLAWVNSVRSAAVLKCEEVAGGE